MENRRRRKSFLGTRLTGEKGEGTERERLCYISRNDAFLAELINQSWPHAAYPEKGREKGERKGEERIGIGGGGRSTSGDGGLLFSRSTTKQRTKSHRRGLINERRACRERRTIMRLRDTNCPRVAASHCQWRSACIRAYISPPFISNEKIIYVNLRDNHSCHQTPCHDY